MEIKKCLKLCFIFVPVALASGASANPVFDLPERVPERGFIYFLNEIAEDTHEKFEFRTRTGSYFLDRVLCARKVIKSDRVVHNYPVSYGISPGRFNVDRDPLDLIVLGGKKIYQDMTQKREPKLRLVKVIGTLKFDECENVPCIKELDWKQDWKIFAIDADDQSMKNVERVEDLSKEKLASIQEFFSNYKGSKLAADGKEYPQTRVTGFLDKNETLALIEKDFQKVSPEVRKAQIRECHDLYNEIFKSRALPKLTDEYLACVQWVENPQALRGAEGFDFFLKYDSSVRLLQLGERDFTMENAVTLMENRKGKGKTYYRFVGADRPAPPGTNRIIQEWVETKNRNKGCAANFPSQHYESRPIVDLDF